MGRRMRGMMVLIFCALTGCDSPRLEMRGVPARQVQVGPSSFSVYQLGARVEAIRTNPEIGPAAQGIMARGYAAIELATGCEIISDTFDGDPALMRASVFCPSGG